MKPVCAEFDEPEAAVRGEGIPEFIDADLGAVGVAGAIHQEIAEEEWLNWCNLLIFNKLKRLSMFVGRRF